MVLVFRFSFHGAQATTQEAKFCCKYTASKVPERHSHWCMDKGERKRNKELRALSRVLQGQPLSTCRILWSHLSHPGQLKLFPFSCATKPFPPHSAVVPQLAGWSQDSWNASKPRHSSPHVSDLPEIASAVQDGFLMGSVHRRRKVRVPLAGRLPQFAEVQFE